VSKVNEYMNTLKLETIEKINLFSAQIEIEGHIVRVNSAMSTLQRNMYLLFDSVIKAQQGVLQPQII